MAKLPLSQFCILFATSLGAFLAPISLSGQENAVTIDFSRDVQPILSENCYFCHGQDGERREAGLRLDVEDEALAVIEKGDAESSELFLRMISEDDDELMPPPTSHRKLTPKQIETVRNWINAGAQWNQHWAFRPIQSSDHDSKSIDDFVSKKLHDRGLDLSKQADKATLIRRVSIDLTGLPPTQEELKRFMADDSADSYRKMVNHYLDSPAYGERMAWIWLDAARYADTNGYQGDRERTMWPWRDWVVQSYNNNMPFDQFSKWQLAGDLQDDASIEQRLATAFNRNHPINGEGGRIAEENRIDYVMDMAETTGTVWMGLTFNCCRCHDHKYDQLSQADYYQLFAFFNQTPVSGGGGDPQTNPNLAVPSEAQRKRLAALQQERSQQIRQRETLVESLKSNQESWEIAKLEQLGSQSTWQIIELTERQANFSTLKPLADQSVLATGKASNNDDYVVGGKLSIGTVNAIRLEALPHESMTNGGLSHSTSSNFVLTEFTARLASPDQPEKTLRFKQAKADFEQLPVRGAIDDDPRTGWAVWTKDKDMRQPHEAIFYLAEPLQVPSNSKIEFVLRHQSVHAKHNLGRFRISTSADETIQLGVGDPKLYSALQTKPDQRTQHDAELVLRSLLETDEKYRSMQSKIDSTDKAIKALEKSVPKVMIMSDRDKPRKTFMLNRGSYQEPTTEVVAQIPSIFGNLKSEQGLNRRDLADWLFDESNPLTARVTVNRLWAQVFGTGLVKTTEDFGVQGEPPSHPELLDWLATEYRESGWDTKHMFRLILNSRTYRQSSQVSKRLLEQAPNNRLLARSPRYRMPSWMLRDYALAASGRLTRTVGGPPVNPYQPAGVWEEASFGKKKFKLDQGDALYRRSLYTFWRRIAAPTMFFDNSDRMTCSVKRYLTNTPLHALNTLNDTTFVEAARLLASQAMLQGETEIERLDFVFKSVLSRSSDQAEQAILLSALNRTLNQFKSDSKSANALINVGESEPESTLDSVELASWTSLCLAVLNLDEALTRQ